MKKPYRSPELARLGRVQELTLGQNQCDLDNSQGQNNTANQNNGQDGGGCAVVGS
jgi:hypothetical protein